MCYSQQPHSVATSAQVAVSTLLLFFDDVFFFNLGLFFI